MLLHAVTVLPEELLRYSVTYLHNTGFLQETRLLSEPTYTCTHRLRQEVIYGSLSQKTRQQLHAQILQVYLEHCPDRARTELPPLAQHYAAAGRHQEAAASWQQAGQETTARQHIPQPSTA